MRPFLPSVLVLLFGFAGGLSAQAPVADFSGTPQAGSVPLIVNFSDLSTGTVSSWSWDFGDGGSSTLANPTHFYTTSGTYSVSLTVGGPGGSDIESKADYIVASDLVITGILPTMVDALIPGTAKTVTINGIGFTASTTVSVEGVPVDPERYSVVGGTTIQLDMPQASTLGPVSVSVHENGFTASSSVTVVAPATPQLEVGTGDLLNELTSETGVRIVVGGQPGHTHFVQWSPSDEPSINASVSMDIGNNFTQLFDAAEITIPASGWMEINGPLDDLEQPTVVYLQSFVTGAGIPLPVSNVQTVFLTFVAPQPDFSATPLTGFAPLQVDFTDLTVGQVNEWSWDFGDGGTATVQNPSHIYNAAGTYTVTLTTTGFGGVANTVMTDLIMVEDPPPVADFGGTPTTGDAPLQVTFNDLSTGPISTWSWDFGDGNSDTAQNPVHTYALPGLYSVTLNLSGPGGTDSITKVDFIDAQVPAPPVPDFSATPASGLAPLNVAFSDLTTGQVSSWSWTFGDGGSSSLQNPPYTYASAGTYDVSLTATGLGGSAAITKVGFIVVGEAPPVADFVGTPTAGGVPLNVSFTDTSSGAVTAWSWDFGDGGNAFIQNPGHTYSLAGTYTVTLTATGPGGSDAETKVGYVVVSNTPPTADFVGSPTSGMAPLSVDFSDQSTGLVTAYSWNFGDGGSSTEASPTHVFSSAGTFSVSLSVQGPLGSDLELKPGYVVVNAAPPVADFSGTPTSGAAPLLVNFSDLSTGSVTNWSWDFGDGGSSSLPNPAHSYAAGGTYTVSLVATGPGGSDGETKVDFVVVAPTPPVADFFGLPNAGTSILTTSFDDASTGLVTSWFWDFGDGLTSTNAEPQHSYVASGLYTVTLTVTGPDGSDVESKTNYIDVDGPTAITGFSPSSVDALVPGTAQTVTIQGYGLPAAGTVEVDGLPIDPARYTFVSPTQFTLDMPQVDRLGTIPVGIRDGSTLVLNGLDVVVPDPAQLQTGTGDPLNVMTSAEGATAIMGGNPGDLHYVLYSTSNVPSVAPIVSLEIGNAFSELFTAVVLNIPAKGWIEVQGTFTVPGPVTLYAETVVFGYGSPFPTSNSQSFVLTP